jgi:rRNA-processing protein FCF1
MNAPSPKNADSDHIFSLETIFPEADGLFFGEYKNLHDCASESIFVLDTNVLLMPYSLGKQSIAEIQKVYSALLSENRLFIPERVAREFASNRAAKVADIYNAIQANKKGQANPITYPLINDLPEKKLLDKAMEQLKNAQEEYYHSINALLKTISNWEWADPVSSIYSSLFSSNIIRNHLMSNEELIKELSNRQKLKIPPGYKDSAKDDNGVGDLAIWLTLLELGKSLKRHVIFVSEERKSDWWQKSGGAALLPRYELVDEYRRSSEGKSLHIIKLSDLLQLHKAATNAVEEAQSVERMKEEQAGKTRKNILLAKEKERTQFGRQSRSTQKAEMLEWFHTNYIDPAEVCPYISAEGGYQYVWGGPYDAMDGIRSQYEEFASESLIKEVSEELNSICWEWSGHPDGGGSGEL